MQLMEDFEEVMQEMKRVGKAKHTKHEKMIKKVKASYKKNAPLIFKHFKTAGPKPNQSLQHQESTDMFFTDHDIISEGSDHGRSFARQQSQRHKSDKKRSQDPLAKEVEDLEKEVNDQKDRIRSETEDLQRMQRQFRDEYEDTIGTFQSNMSLLSFHSERIQKMF